MAKPEPMTVLEAVLEALDHASASECGCERIGEEDMYCLSKTHRAALRRLAPFVAASMEVQRMIEELDTLEPGSDEWTSLSLRASDAMVQRDAAYRALVAPEEGRE